MPLSPICEVKVNAGPWLSTTGGIDGSDFGGDTISIRLADTTGVVDWYLQVTGTDETSTAPVLTGVDGDHHVASPSTVVTLTLPAGYGKAFLFQTLVTGVGGPIQTTFTIYTPTIDFTRVGAVGEAREGDQDFGWITKVNPRIRNPGWTYLALTYPGPIFRDATTLAWGDVSGEMVADLTDPYFGTYGAPTTVTLNMGFTGGNRTRLQFFIYDVDLSYPNLVVTSTFAGTSPITIPPQSSFAVWTGAVGFPYVMLGATASFDPHSPGPIGDNTADTGAFTDLTAQVFGTATWKRVDVVCSPARVVEADPAIWPPSYFGAEMVVTLSDPQAGTLPAPPTAHWDFLGDFDPGGAKAFVRLALYDVPLDYPALTVGPDPLTPTVPPGSLFFVEIGDAAGSFTIRVLGSGGTGGGTRTVHIPDITANYQVLTADDLLPLDSTGGSFTVILTLTPSLGDEYTGTDVTGQAGTNPITLDGNGGLINGSGTFLLNVAYASITVTCTGVSPTRWSVT